MNETITVSSKSTAEQLDKWQLRNYNLSETSRALEATGAPLAYRILMDDEESENEADIAIAKQRLEEMRNNPLSTVSGEALRDALAELELK